MRSMVGTSPRTKPVPDRGGTIPRGRSVFRVYPAAPCAASVLWLIPGHQRRTPGIRLGPRGS